VDQQVHEDLQLELKELMVQRVTKVIREIQVLLEQKEIKVTQEQMLK
jgi:hypothetical protein